jgi:hypothetical protein
MREVWHVGDRVCHNQLGRATVTLPLSDMLRTVVFDATGQRRAYRFPASAKKIRLCGGAWALNLTEWLKERGNDATHDGTCRIRDTRATTLANLPFVRILVVTLS